MSASVSVALALQQNPHPHLNPWGQVQVPLPLISRDQVYLLPICNQSMLVEILAKKSLSDLIYVRFARLLGFPRLDQLFPYITGQEILHSYHAQRLYPYLLRFLHFQT